MILRGFDKEEEIPADTEQQELLLSARYSHSSHVTERITFKSDGTFERTKEQTSSESFISQERIVERKYVGWVALGLLLLSGGKQGISVNDNTFKGTIFGDITNIEQQNVYAVPQTGVLEIARSEFVPEESVLLGLADALMTVETGKLDSNDNLKNLINAYRAVIAVEDQDLAKPVAVKLWKSIQEKAGILGLSTDALSVEGF